MSIGGTVAPACAIFLASHGGYFLGDPPHEYRHGASRHRHLPQRVTSGQTVAKPEGDDRREGDQRPFRGGFCLSGVSRWK